MLIEKLFSLWLDIQFFLLTIPPDLPPMPQSITDAGDIIISMFADAANVVAYLYGTVFYKALLGVSIVAFSFDYLYKFLIWILRKIPLLNIE